MATRQFNSADEFKTWLSTTLLVLVDHHIGLFNDLSCDSYPDRFLACDILHDYVGGCWSASYHVQESLRDFVFTESDPYFFTDELAIFLRNSVRTSFGVTANFSYGCSLVDILCSFLDDLEVYEKEGVVYVEY